MAEEITSPGFREFPLRAPPGWRQKKKISLRTKRLVLELQRNKDAITGKPLKPGKFQYDHRPCIADRDFDPVANDTIPAFDDPRYIFAIATSEHGALTPKDTSRIAKTKRMNKTETQHRLAVMAKNGDAIPKAPRWKETKPWPKRAIQSRNNLLRSKRPPRAGSPTPEPPQPTSKATTTTTPPRS